MQSARAWYDDSNSATKVTIDIPKDLLCLLNDKCSESLQGDTQKLILECIKYAANHASHITTQKDVDYEELVGSLNFDTI
ncbi:hypothetical protein GGQ84_002686 [Desulfitispora alkaliphila]|uniref:hypothetical protein n=1 Tax=Desulfitispora alkaliphila TaxID=622674 RepID=UPI003D1A3C85